MAPTLERLREKLLANYSFVLVGLIGVSFLPALFAGFVWDDDENILLSPNLRDWAGLKRLWSDPHATQQFYPLTHTSFWLQARSTGLSPLPFHTVNVALHALTALLALAVLRRLAVAGAEFAATLFALHPLNVETVAWVTERKNVLSGALALAACLFYLRFDELAFGAATHAAGERRGLGRRGNWWLALVAFVLALSAKTAVAPLPAALLVVLVGLRGRRARHALLPLLPWFGAGIAAGLGTAYLERTHVHAQGAEFMWSVADRVLIAGRAFWFYPQKLVLPVGLVFFYPKWNIDHHALLGWGFPVLALASLALFAGLRKRVGNAPLLAFLAYGALIFPALGFFNVYFMRFAYVQNHFQYLAGIPVLAALTALGVRLLGRSRDSIRFGVATALVLACGASSFLESSTYRSYESLFETTLQRNPTAWVAAYNLGNHYQAAGKRDAALTMYRRARELRPHDPKIALNLGVALAEAGHAPEALGALKEAIALDPTHPEARLDLALVLERAKRPAEAVLAYREALRLRPDYTRAKRELAWLLATSSDSQVRDGRAALEWAKAACAETVKAVARCQDTLAAAEASSGDFTAAAQRAAHAADLARHEGQDADAQSYEARARLYAAQRAYLETEPK